MKTKLGHLIMASLISLCCIFSTTSDAFSGSRLSKASDYYSNTTSASGFNEGPITQKNSNGFVHFEVKEDFDLKKNSPEFMLKEDFDQKNHPQYFDLEITVERYLFNKVRLTIKNLGTMDIDGEFYIHFKLVDRNIFDHDGFAWYGLYEIPDPLSTTTHIKDIFAWQNEYWANWGLSVAANVEAFNLYNELTYHNNYDYTTNYF